MSGEKRHGHKHDGYKRRKVGDGLEPLKLGVATGERLAEELEEFDEAFNAGEHGDADK